ncbi:hypothetical protein, partial [Siccibacter turicensis]|uniref:hypothetical protein n=1 Tax=Siccibacter turicensis TaxID=357233 RepID=UPI001C6319B8
VAKRRKGVSAMCILVRGDDVDIAQARWAEGLADDESGFFFFLGRFDGTGRSTVPMACGADVLGTLAQPASTAPRNNKIVSRINRSTPRAHVGADVPCIPVASVADSVARPVAELAAGSVSWAAGWW